MFLLALACTDPGLAPGPYVEPTVQEVWLTAGPDEIHARATSAAGSQYVYEDVVELPPDTLAATLVVSAGFDDAPCAPVDVFLGARSQGWVSESRRSAPGARLAAHHDLDPRLFREPLELFASSRSPGTATCPPGPTMDVDGMLLWITRGAVR